MTEMSCFRFAQIRIPSKDFYKQKQITDMFRIDVSQVVVSDKVSCNNGKDWWYVVGYRVDGKTIIPLFIKTPKTIFSYCVSQYDKKSTYTMSFNDSEILQWVLHYRNIWNEIDVQLFEKKTTEPINIHMIS